MTENKIREVEWNANRKLTVHGLLFLRNGEIHLFYNLQVFYWHFLEILWLFIFLVLYHFFISLWSARHQASNKMKRKRRSVPRGYSPTLETKERECWKLRDSRLNSEFDSRVHGQPYFSFSEFNLLIHWVSSVSWALRFHRRLVDARLLFKLITH